MENGWYFPSSFEAWKQHGTDEVLGIETEIESGLITNDLLVSQPLQSEANTKPKKKKKRRPRSVSYETFHDKYSLSSQVLGRGANSLVSLATDKDQKQYAVKIIDKFEGYDRCRVLREIDLLHFLGECPNILQLVDFYEEEDKFYLVFERMEGGHLLKHIERKTYFTEREASLVVNDIATALKFLHDKGIAHRDLKPDNILCINADSIVPVVICDFNLASGISMVGSATTPELYTPVGSAEYMAPEIVDAFVGDAPAYDKRCDLWSLGVILYIMLSGRPPFEGDCGRDCEWKDGGSCSECQSLLWHGILDADYAFPDEGWMNVSLEAKDLISHLLVKEASKRYSVDSVLSHPWLKMASDNQLNTPDVLSSESITHRLSTVTSEAVAYRRIISERQNSSDEEHHVITRWSTPPKFGLSPPGNSRLAKRRSLKNKLNSLSLTNIRTENKSDSANTTPIQSPSVGAIIEQLFEKQSDQNDKSSAAVHEDMRAVIKSLKNGLLLDLSPEENSSHGNTPVATPRMVGPSENILPP
ncbi:MAP kinase-interacting serine/threonine-protein kinase 1-like [Hydractinia symbiolongicarpus]|uniref:MAP kinase-interacting serine/threonine-protein kinase 1-like n=1 Tax=Hydractinia symbiolongicarpus TaxID=13093 RepID=UPI00254E8141|nr:MAP kinase-interacting serine/threonine-protein kinase 1-like [Hydractinia symbiolongicarpus]XP_057298488.1 MAP kinase-interacting serine/threonine-protein kinase 1-like [Hydractinia symbiolongicarpus]XP_057298621.1 MAP kinase-interacting serine/threonine-protein kinase 1-like [Hydractinia symbiolongicarpus]XP_057298622.1 MAP kinase-interacting serine/threonine-protein kinase 1-like [Hydractinia symbiolongicarpus]